MGRIQTKGNQTADVEANRSFAITASDTASIAIPGAKVHCNSTGNYNLLLEGDKEPQVFFLVAGVTYPFRVKRVYATNTDDPAGLVGISNIIVEGTN